MSVINQVLNQLEQRGANTAPEQTMVRAVPQSRRNYTLPLLAFAGALIAGLIAWKELQPGRLGENRGDKPEVEAVSVALQQPVPIAPMPVGQMLVATMPVTAIADTTITDARIIDPAVTEAQNKTAAPTKRSSPALPPPMLRLSFALDSVALPATTDMQPKAKAAQQNTKQNARQNDKQPVKKSVPAKAQVADQTSSSVSPLKQVSQAQRADAEFRKAVTLMQQGRIADAVAGYETALRLDDGHDAARQALVALLLENKRGVEAEQVLQERLKSKPDHTAFTMLLARLQVERGAAQEAIATLEASLPYARTQPEYHAFLAALLQRQNRNEEAIAHYQIVTKLAPGNGVWLMGYGISLQAMQRKADAKAAFQKALETQTLSADLQAFVQGKIKEL